VRRAARREVGSDEPAYRDALAAIEATCERLARGDFEARVPALAGPAAVQQARASVNRVADVTDAFVREASASLAAASEGRLHRRFLPRGMRGNFGTAATAINAARAAMAAAAAQTERDQRDRDDLAGRIHEVSEHVAAASTELSASAANLAQSTHTAVGRAESALRTVHLLEQSSGQIQAAATLIKQIASQTRLLALNATIEAAHAAEAGHGFAVVAGEVKTLADEVSRSSDSIAAQIAAAQQATVQAVHAITEVAGVIEDMDRQVDGIASAASGGADGTGGLSHMAETLRAEMYRFAGHHTD
jgi:methyl-accepting chemotaxis protein